MGGDEQEELVGVEGAGGAIHDVVTQVVIVGLYVFDELISLGVEGGDGFGGGGVGVFGLCEFRCFGFMAAISHSFDEVFIFGFDILSFFRVGCLFHQLLFHAEESFFDEDDMFETFGDRPAGGIRFEVHLFVG